MLIRDGKILGSTLMGEGAGGGKSLDREKIRLAVLRFIRLLVV